MTFAEKIIAFNSSLEITTTLPENVIAMNPYKDQVANEIAARFYTKYYSDNNKRWLIIGINPGRFGGGITGIPFTDPIRLENDLGIPNPWVKKQELSSLYVYDLIRNYGGPEAFYGNFYFTAVSPLGFVKHNKNMNYYDDRALESSIRDFVIDCLHRQLEFGVHQNVAFCLGEGKNFQYLGKLNEEIKAFERIIPLSHPRFIMQYRLKRKDEYIQHYIKQFQLFC